VVVGLTTGADGGDQLVGDEGAAAEFFDLVRATSILGRLPVRRIPFHVSTLYEVFIMVDPELIAVAAGDAEVRASQNATCEMADAAVTQSSSATVTPTNVVSMFQTTAIIGEVSANWRVIQPGAVQYFT
jgi:hypothetical protein